MKDFLSTLVLLGLLAVALGVLLHTFWILIAGALTMIASTIAMSVLRID